MKLEFLLLYIFSCIKGKKKEEENEEDAFLLLSKDRIKNLKFNSYIDKYTKRIKLQE